ncbi:MAG: radical SAM protein [Chloroflexota bacterium]
MTDFVPAYLKLSPGELAQRAELARLRMSKCDLCPRRCNVDRLSGELGVCRTGAQALISSYGAHMGEENPLRGWRGSGTIFFTHCNLRCQFCQNYDISQSKEGAIVTPEELAAVMLDLQAGGCHNINFVSPSHVVAPILEALVIAAGSGLRLPLVYNSGGYDSPEALRLLDGVVDIYMPDMKYSDARTGHVYSLVRDYPAVNRAAVREMYRQVGDLVIGRDGLAQRGLLVRHLVLPNKLAGTRQVARFLADEISPDTYLNVMAQYHPAYHADRYPLLNRRITGPEYQEARKMAKAAGLTRLDER